ncbi:MAG TPA: hypothetical protein VMR34_00455 [Candidatus Saccharimonadales bacterium]|nr:hypothetical protein [Candidatus Saccharimonadales bacterium]
MDIGLKPKIEQPVQHHNHYSELAKSTGGGEDHPTKSKRTKGNLYGMRFLTSLLLLGIAAIVVMTIAFLAVGRYVYGENTYVNKNEYQAVFVNVTGSSGGQAYFGHISSISPSYIVLTGVFYLQPGASANQFTLNNLSCTLYGPEDTMVINRAQVDFWENITSGSQVAKNINTWNSDKLQCSSTTGSQTPVTSGTDNSSTSTTTK